MLRSLVGSEMCIRDRNELMKVEGRLVELPEQIIKVVCRHVLRGLAWLHKHRKIHRDVKGCNVLLTEGGQAKLADFGISAKMSTCDRFRQTVIGTPFWMAPEVIGSEQRSNFGYDCKADIWSLGITALEMAETRPPHAEKHHMKAMMLIHNGDPPKLKKPDKWSLEFNNFLARCLVKDTADRASAAELLEDAFITSAHDVALQEFIRVEWSNIVARRKLAAERPEVYSGSDYQDGDLDESSSVQTEDDGTAVFHQLEDEPHDVGMGTSVFHAGTNETEAMGTTVFHGGVDNSGTAVFAGGEVGNSGTAVFHGGKEVDSGTAVFLGGLRNDTASAEVASDAEDLDIEHKRMTEDIMADLQRLDEEGFDPGTVVFKQEVKKPGKKSSRKSVGRRRVSETRGRSSDAPSPEDDARSTEGSASAETSGSEDAPDGLHSKKEGDKPKKKKKPKSELSEDESKKGKRKSKRTSSAHLLPVQEFDNAVLMSWSLEQLETECGQLEGQRKLELARVNQRFDEKRKALEEAISIRRLEEGSSK
eukprot:TRINITY_DN2233_c0_g1_i4.p1 TRINITY_DN2233_c0_g1~~TRINITY_DN2233_c0_g1_i4.p1  ORF type:complete len:563 (-),score=102.42 TRINITY_DN2233_c0_g1_i4:215-1816(-)